MLLTEHAREGKDGLMDYLGVLDRIFATRLPAQHPNLTAVALLVAENEDDLGQHEVRFEVEGPGGRPMFEHLGTFQMRAGGGTWLGSARLIFRLVGFTFREYGNHVLRFRVDGRGMVCEHQLSVATPPAKK
jgi:hypothetical protein